MFTNSDYSPENAVDIDSVGFAEKGFRTFYRSLGHTSVRPALYDYHARQKAGENINKDRIRKWTLNEVGSFFLGSQKKSDGRPIRFLTLPGPLLLFEQGLRGIFKGGPRGGIGTVFTCLERDWTTFGCAALELTKICQRDGILSDAHPLRHAISPSMNCQVISAANYQLINDDLFSFIKVARHKFHCAWIDTQTPLSYLKDKLPLVEPSMRSDIPVMVIITVLAAREHEPLEMSRVEFIKSFFPEFKLERQYEYHDKSAKSPMLHVILTRGNSIIPKGSGLVRGRTRLDTPPPKRVTVISGEVVYSSLGGKRHSTVQINKKSKA